MSLNEAKLSIQPERKSYPGTVPISCMMYGPLRHASLHFPHTIEQVQQCFMFQDADATTRRSCRRLVIPVQACPILV